MGDGFQVDPRELRGYSGMLERVAGQFTAVEGHARAKGGDTAGFTGLLQLLVPAVSGVVDLYGDTLTFANRKITEVKKSLDEAAKAYEDSDRAGTIGINGAGRGLDSVHAPTVRGGAR
ncbi:type VII secretion target [Actinokineospora diospyrosa]|uniref:type VII secretion target n=1 Tax=Actinokineospora diospyrosa TaxID=103728 RepID=UPI0020A58598|nr:type VII secretion target [Actinokineospora diospyrosa]